MEYYLISAVILVFIISYYTGVSKISRKNKPSDEHNYCPFCHKYSLSEYCGKCGKLQPRTVWVVWCPACKNIAIDKYCRNCGAETIEKEVSRKDWY